MDYAKIIGSNIRFERQKRDLTIEELSDILGIAPGFLGLIERGQRGTSIKNLCKITNFFSLTLDDLITRQISGEMEASLVSEDSDAIRKQKLATVTSLAHNLTVEELDFNISFIKGMKKYNKAKFNDPTYDDGNEE